MREAFDPDTAGAAAGRIGEITEICVYEMARTQSEVYGVLDAEQRAEWDAMMERREARRDKWQRRMSSER